MRANLPVLAAAGIGLLLPWAAAEHDDANATFVDEAGAHDAAFSWDGPCNGPGVALLAVYPGGDDVRVLPAVSTMAPDLCTLECEGCIVPFAWTLQDAAGSVALAGGGVTAPCTYSELQGRFDDGALNVRDLFFACSSAG